MLTSQSLTASPNRGGRAERLDQRLDAALLETFPASDPIAVGRPTATEPLQRAGDRRVQGAKVRGPSPKTSSPKTSSPKTSSRRATAMPAATRARPNKKVLRARS